MKTLKIKDNFYWVGQQDDKLQVFDIVMWTKFGSSYNSYLLKTSDGYVLFETVKVYLQPDKHPSLESYLEKIKSICGNLNNIKHVVLNHTEPDHSGLILEIAKRLNKNVRIICSNTASEYLQEIFNTEIKTMPVNDGDKMKIGNTTLIFHDVPMMHWPDSMLTEIVEDKIIVTCDILGSHLSYAPQLVSKMSKDEYENKFKPAFYDYYVDVLSSYKNFVILAEQKIRKLYDEKRFDVVANGHGPALDTEESIIWGLDTYKKYATRKKNTDVNKKHITIVYCSAYGYTEEFVDLMTSKLNLLKDEFTFKTFNIDIKTYPKQKKDILDNFTFSNGILIGTPTIANDTLPIVWDLLANIQSFDIMGKIAGAFGSYGWSGEAVKNVVQRLSQLKFQTLKGFMFRFRMSEKEKTDALKYIDNFIEMSRTRRVLPEYRFNNISWRDTLINEPE